MIFQGLAQKYPFFILSWQKEQSLGWHSYIMTEVINSISKDSKVGSHSQGYLNKYSSNERKKHGKKDCFNMTIHIWTKSENLNSIAISPTLLWWNIECFLTDFSSIFSNSPMWWNSPSPQTAQAPLSKEGRKTKQNHTPVLYVSNQQKHLLIYGNSWNNNNVNIYFVMR